MSRPGWGERITCLEVQGLSPNVIAQLRDARDAILDEIVETWAYSFHPPLYDELVGGCAGFDTQRHPKPLPITARVEVSDGHSIALSPCLHEDVEAGFQSKAKDEPRPLRTEGIRPGCQEHDGASARKILRRRHGW